MMLLMIGLMVLATLLYFIFLTPISYWIERGVKEEHYLQDLSFNWLGTYRRQSIANYAKKMYDQFPNSRYSGIYQFNEPLLVIRDPELMRRILVKDFDHFTERRTVIPEDIDPLWGKNLFALEGSKWRNMRSTMSPAFTSSKMKFMFILIRKCAENYVRHFLGKDQNSIPLNMKYTCSRFCNDVIASTAFGIEVDSLADPKNMFFEMAKKATNLRTVKRFIQFYGYSISPKLYKFFNLKLFDDDVSSFFRSLIDETIEKREREGIVRPDMIHLLMEARSGVVKKEENNSVDTGYATVNESIKGDTVTDITNEDITAHALAFFFAGFESLSSIMSFLAHELAVNQDIQEKLRKEIQESSEISGGNPTYDNLVNMKYLDMVVSEVLRKWPAQLWIERRCTKPYTIQPATPDEKPIHLKEGNALIIPQIGVQRDPENFPDPERFDPERFSDENKSNIKPFTYQPFGHGPRNCIASRFALLQTKILLFYLLLHFEIVPVENTKIPLVLAKNSIVMSAEDGIWLGLKRIVK